MWKPAAVLLAFSTVLPVVGGDTHMLDVPGVVEPIRQISVQTTIDARIASIRVREGQFVQQGELMVQLDDELANAELRMAELAATQNGRVQFAEAELQRAKQVVARLERVNNHHAIAARELEEAQSNYAKAVGNLKVAYDEIASLRMEFERAKLRIREYSISSPFAGVVSKIRVSPGQVVQRQNVMMTLVDTSKLRVEIAVPLSRMKRLQIGQSYRLPVESVAIEEVAAVLLAIDPILNSGTNTVRCVFEIDNPDRQLPAGFLVYPPQERQLN